jgi:hypothetical protein
VSGQRKSSRYDERTLPLGTLRHSVPSWLTMSYAHEKLRFRSHDPGTQETRHEESAVSVSQGTSHEDDRSSSTSERFSCPFTLSFHLQMKGKERVGKDMKSCD